jgi:hypothetical protein
MTIREKVTQQKQLGDILSVSGIGGAMLFFYLANSVNRWFVFLAILSFLAAVAGSFYRFYAIRCPRCKKRLTGGAITTLPTSPFAAPHDVICCPFCGVGFDTEIEAMPSV